MNTYPVICFGNRRFYVASDLLMLQNVHEPGDTIVFKSAEEMDAFINNQDYEVEGLRLVA